MWDQSDKSMSTWLHSISTARIKAPGRPPLLTQHHLTILEASTFLTKILVHPNIKQSYIPSSLTFFLTYTCGIQVLYITINSNQSCHHMQNKISVFVCQRHINLNTPPLTITFITTPYSEPSDSHSRYPSPLPSDNPS